MTSCTADHRSKLRQLLVATFKNHDVSTPFDFTKFIKDFYEKAKLRTGDEFLAFEMAKLLPRLASQVLSTDAAQQTPIEGDLTLAGKMEKDINLGNLYPLMKRYENNTEVQKDLGLTADPNKLLQAAQDVADGDKDVKDEIEPTDKAVKEVIENPFKTIPFGAFFSFGPELIQWTDPSKPGYMQPRPGQERNYASLRYIDAVMRRQIESTGIQDSGEMDLPGVGKVFLKLVHSTELSPSFKSQFPNEYFNAGELVAVVVDEKGKEILFSKEGKPDEKGGPVFFRPYTSIARTEDGGLAFTKKEYDDFFKRTGKKPHGGYAGSFKTINQKVKSIAAEKRKADPSLTEEQAVQQAQKELNDDFATFFKLSDYLIKNPGSSVQGVITGSAQGFIVHNEYMPTPLSEAYASGTFFPFVQDTQTMVTYPGVEEPIVVKNPPLNNKRALLDTILSLFTDELFVVNRAGQKERMSVFERDRLIKQFLLKYSKVQFMAKKDKEGTLTFENFDGSYDININGKPFNIKFDGSPEAQASQKEVREELEKFLTTGAKGIQYTEGFGSETEVQKTLATHPGANIVTDLADAKQGSILKEGDKYFRIEWPALLAVGDLINKPFDKPTISPDKVVTLEEQDYNEFLRENWETTATAVNGAIKKLNPTISYGLTLEGATKFMAPAEKEVEPTVEEKPEEKKPAEEKPNTEATQSNIADMSNDDLLNALKLEKNKAQKAMNQKISAEDLKAHEKAAREWWKSSPLSKVIPFEVMQAVINAENPTGSVAEWSVHGIILYHYYSENGKFDPSKSADYTDLYHEAWHGFTQTFLTQEQRDKLYDEAGKRSGSFVDYNGKLTTFKKADVWQLEEFLAEEFREYMMSGGKKVIKGAPVRNSIFRKLLDMLKALFKGSSVTDVVQDPLSNNMIKQMYDNLRVGDLSAYNFDINNRDTTIGKLNKSLVARNIIEGQPSMLNYDQSMLLVNTMDSIISGIVDSQNKTSNTSAWTSRLMSTANNRRSVYELVKRKLRDEVIPNLKAEQEKEENPILKNQIGERIKLVEWAIEQFGDTEDLRKNQDGKGLIAYHAAKSKFLSVEDKLALLEEEAQGENSEEEDMAGKDNKFGSSGSEVSQYELAAPEVKYLLRSIYRYDEKNQPVNNNLGVQELNEASVMWNKIVRALDGVMSMPDMYKKLDKAATTDPALRQLLNKIGPIKANGSAAETDLWINFWKTFNMVNIPLVQMTMEESTSDKVTTYRMKIGAANTASRQALNLWRNSFLSLNTEYIKTDDQNRNYLDVQKVINEFTDPETGALKKDKSFEFLKAIGLRLTDKGAIRDAINKGTGNAPQLFLKLKRLGDPNGRNINQLRSLDELFKEYPAENGIKEERGDEPNLKALAELETRNSDFSSNYSVTNAKGNMQFEQSLHNSMSIMVTTINMAEDVKDEQGNVIQTAYDSLISIPSMKHLDIEKNPFAASSIWLNSVFMLYDNTGKQYPKETFGKRRIIDGKPVELKLSNLSGVQMVGETDTIGVDSAGADEFTKLIMDFHLQLEANRPELMRHADKGTSYSVWLTDTFGTGGTSGRYADIETFYNTGTPQEPNIKAYTNMHKVIKRYIDAEVKRMAKMRQMKEAVKRGDKVTYDANYINEGQKMLIFESILSPDTKKMLENVGSLQEALDKNPDLDTLIRNDIESYFEGQVTDLENLVKKDKTKFIDNNLILQTQGKARAKNIPDYTKSSTEKALFRAFVLNNWTHHVESMNIIYGDIAQYNMAKEEFHKRNAGAGSTGNLFATNREIIEYVNNKGRLYAKSQKITEKKLAMDGSYDSAIMADNEIPSVYLDEIKEGIEDSIRARYERKLELAKGDEKELAKLEKEIKDKVKQATKAYTEMEEGNAQGWITFDFYRAASIMEGKWTTKQEKMYNDICNGVPYTPEEVAQFFPTKKYQYWGPIQTDKDQLPLHGFHKFSLLPLIPTVIEGTNLKNLHEKMMKQNVDYALFKSGSKIATITNLSYNKEKDIIEADQDKFYTKDRNFDADSTFVKNTAFFQYLKNQLEIAPKYKRKVTFPTQMRKLIENGLYENGVPLRPEFEQLVLAYEKDLADLTEIKKEKLLKEAGIKRDESGNLVFEFNEKLRQFLIRELERQDLAEHEIDFIRKAPRKNELARDLSISLSSQKLEKILTSIVIKRLVKQKFNGEGLIQVSGVGWETNLRGKLSDEEKLKYGTNELPFYRREVLSTDKNGKKTYGKTLAMKVKIALQGDFVKLLGLKHKDGAAIGDLKRLNEMLKDEEWLNTGDHRKMISITGPRIPTQENNSMEFAEVYEFLPKEAGNIVVLPSEIVAKSGGDFDIDKITFMMPNIKSKPNYEDIDFKAIGERFPDFGEEGARTIFENREEEVRSEEEQEVLDAIYDSVPVNVTLPFDSKSEAGLENRIIDDMRKILELKELYANLVRPNATDLIEPIARELEDKVSDYKPRTVEYTDKKGKAAYRIPGSRVFEIRYNLYKHSSNSIGKQTLGLGAVDNTYNTIFNRIGARFNAGYTTKNNVYRKLELLLPHNTMPDQDGNPTISISHLYDVEGTSISSVIAQMINGWVDIAKDAWIFNVQGNKEIAPTLLFMVQAGIPVRQAVYYVSHPLIRQYVTEQKMAKSIFAKPLGKGEGNPMYAKNEARKQIFKLLYGEKKANDLKSGKALDEHFNTEMENLLNDPESKAFGFFNADKVEKNLLDKIKEGEKEKYDDADKAIFLHFLEMEDMAKGLRDIKMSTNVDTSRTNSIYEAETKQAKIDAAESNKMFPTGMVKKIRSQSPISSFFIQDFQIAFLKELFPLKANETINKFILAKTRDKQTFKDALEMAFGDEEELINTFRNDLPAFIFQNQLRKTSRTDKNEYRGVLLNKKYTVKTTPSLKFGVFVKNVEGQPVIYLDKDQVSKNFKNLGNLDESVKLEDGTVVTPAPVNQSYFDTEQAYAAFLMERELIRFRYTQPGKFNLFKERLDFKATVEKLKSSELKLEGETDAHFEARINTMAFEQTIRDMALDNTYNMTKFFTGDNTIADQLVQIQANYPDLMNEYSVLRNLAPNFTETGNQRIGNVMLNDSLLDSDKLNVYNQNLKQLSNPATIKLDPSVPEEEKLRLTQFFSNFGIYAFLQSGMNTTGKYSLTRLVPQGQFTRLMTTFLQGENIEGAQTPGFMQNINEITLEKYWRKFLRVNAFTNSNRKKFKNYVMSAADGSYNPAGDKRNLDKLFPQTQYNTKAELAKDYVSGITQEKKEEKDKGKTKYKPITFSQDANGNQLYDGKEAGLTFAAEALKEKPDGMFVINGVASVDGKPPQLGNPTTGESTILNVSKGANSLNFPVRKAFGTVGFQLTDVTPSGKPVEVKPEEKKQVLTNDPAKYTNHSGGAKGGDMTWDAEGRKIGVTKHEHYTTEFYEKLSDANKTKVEERYIAAAKFLGRNTLPATSYAGKLVRRDMIQASKGDAVFGVTELIKPGTKGRKGYVNKMSYSIPEGGTGYAVASGILLNKPVYVFNQSDAYGNEIGWYKWDSSKNDFVKVATPTLTESFTGIGTTEINETGKQAIRDVYANTFKPQAPVSIQSSTSVKGFQGYKGGFEDTGKGTPQGDGKDKAMRAVATGAIVEFKTDKAKSSSLTTLETVGQNNAYSYEKDRYVGQSYNGVKNGKNNYGAVVMLARNGKLSGTKLSEDTKAEIKIAYNQGSEFVVGDMPGVDSQFIDYLQEIGAKFTIYHTGNTPRIQVKQTTTQQQAPVSTLGPETKINIYAGTGENAELSNFAERPFVGTILGGLGGQQFTSVEQAFQYAKGEYYNIYAIDPSSKETPDTMRAKVEAHLKKILAAKTGAEAKALGRKDIGVDFEDGMWDENSPAIMKQLLKESFQQNPDALAKLLATGNATLTHVGTEKPNKWTKEFPRLLMEVRAELRGTQLMTTPVDTASNIDSTVQTSMKDDSKTIQPVPGNTVNPELAKQIDSMIENMKSVRDSGKTLYFPKTGIGQYMIGADEITGELPSGKIVPVAPATFVYLSQKLWDNFKYANPNFDVALGYMGMTNVLQEGAEVNDLDVMEALSVCFKSIIP